MRLRANKRPRMLSEELPQYAILLGGEHWVDWVTTYHARAASRRLT
jgi:hypothetical protein